MSTLVKLAFTKKKETLLGDLRAVQVLGVEVVDHAQRERRILPGLSMPASTALGEQTFFLQESTVWDETTWERGFVQRKEHVGHNSEKQKFCRLRNLCVAIQDFGF